MYQYTSQPRRDSAHSYMSPSSSYQGSPSTAQTTPIQPLQSPIMTIPPLTRPMSSQVYRDNSTALRYTLGQLANLIWRQNPWEPQTGELSPGTSYTDLTTGLTFTHEQMREITRPVQLIQPQPQPQQQSQQHVQLFYHRYNEQRRIYEQGMQILREAQEQMPPHGQAHLMPQAQRQQVRQWVQQPLGQHQMQPHTHWPLHGGNASRTLVTDQHGRQWTQEQHYELLRRQQVQRARVSPEVSPRSQPQPQHVSQVSPPLVVSPTSYSRIHNTGRNDTLTCPQTHMQPPLPPTHPQTQQLSLPVSQVAPREPKERPATSQCGAQLKQQWWKETARRGEAQKSLLPPSKACDATKTPLPAKLSTQPTAHKQCIRKTQKQPRQQRATSFARPKTPEATEIIDLTETEEIKVVPVPVTKRPPNPDMPPPPLPCRSQDNIKPTQARKPKQPSSKTAHSPLPPPTRAPVLDPSVPQTSINMIEVENGTHIQDAISNYLSACQRDRNDALVWLNTPQRHTPQPSTNANTAKSPSREPCPPNNMVTNLEPAVLGTYQQVGYAPAYPGFEDYAETNADVPPDADEQEVLRSLCTVDEDGGLRAPEERSMSEERARLGWEMLVTWNKYGDWRGATGAGAHVEADAGAGSTEGTDRLNKRA